MKDFDNLAAYLPASILKQLTNDQKFKLPSEQSFKTVCLFADVSGFTALSERLCAEGPDGIEELSSQLNKYMAQVVKLTSRAGGDVLKFAGDAMFAIWPPEDGDLLNSLLRAIQCSLDMQLRLTKFGFVFRYRDKEGREVATSERLQGELNIKLGIGIGDCSIFYVGGESDNVMPERYEYVALGPALEEAFQAEACAKKGEVIISKAAYNMVKSQISCDLVVDSGGGTKEKCYLVHKLKNEVRWRKKGDDINSAPSSEIEAKVWKMVPAAVLPYLNESNEFWAPELRRVTTLFCNLGYGEQDLVKVELETIQRTFKAMQQCVFQFEGTINKFLCDDKGSTLLVVFGLPPFAHENDATRGVLAAMSILASLHELGRDGAIGITTGEAFCGVVGTRGNRREYSVIGDTINTAARLMSEAQKRGCGHLMDRNTYNATREDLNLESFGDVLLKGKEKEMPVFQVSGGTDAPSIHVQKITGLPSPRNDLDAKKSAQSMAAASAEKKKKKTGKALPPTPVELAGNSAGPSSSHMAQTQKLQVAAITEAQKLKMTRDAALKMRHEQLNSKDKAAALIKGLNSFAAQSQKGLQMGSGRARSPSQLDGGKISPQPLNLNRSRTVKAAQITFENCATIPGSKSMELSTTFTLPIVEGINTFYDLKEKALNRLGTRQLLNRGPRVDRAFFSLKWNEPNNGRDYEITNENDTLDDIRDLSNPMIRLILIEHEKRRPDPKSQISESTPSSSSASASNPSESVSSSSIAPLMDKSDPNRDLVLQLELIRNNLIWGDGSGAIIIVEGTQGVGKSKTAEEVFLKSDVVANVLTGVAMGNPYETERLSSPLSVWSVLLKQLLEEAITMKQIASGAVVEKPVNGEETEDELNQMLVISRSAMHAFDPKFSNHDALDALVSSIVRTGHLPGVRASINLGDDDKTYTGGDSGLKSMMTMLAHLVVGLSLDCAPVIVLIDDSHFMDLASWRLTLKLADCLKEKKARVLVVLLHRHLILAEMFSASGESNDDILAGVDHHNMRAIENKHTKNRGEIAKLYNELLIRDEVVHMEKKADPAKTGQIICETLEVDTVPEALLTVLTNKSDGNALFIRAALAEFREEKLFEIRGRQVILHESFYDRAKYHELPIPPSVEGICATLLDTMSITQQIALKVAAIIGETFTLNLVSAVFPITHLKPGLIEEWGALVRLGVVVERGNRLVSTSETIYTFSNGWMVETLKKRMLGKQRRKLLEIYKLICEEKEEATRMKFMENALNKLTVSACGWLSVRKDHPRSMLHPWKKRWVVLQQDELVQYYDETNPKKLEVIKLSAEGTSVSNRPGGFMGLESNFGEKHIPFCFVVNANRWIKKGMEQMEPRVFFMAPDSLKDQSDWVFKIGFQIDFYRMQTKTGEEKKSITDFDVYAKSLPKVWGTDAGSHMSSIAGIKQLHSNASMASMTATSTASDGSMTKILSKITNARKSTTPQPPVSHSTISVRARGRSAIPIGGSPSNPNGKNSDVALGTEFQNPGVSIVPMTAANFKAISRDEALANFWASDTTTVDDVLVLRSSHHVSWFYEFGDMALVSLNGQGAIDGYLLGFVSSRTPDHAVVHQCAVIPMVRRYGVGTKLYHKFYELARKRSCRWLRSLVPRDNLGAIAFHRALGFDELGGDDWLATDMIVFILELKPELMSTLSARG